MPCCPPQVRSIGGGAEVWLGYQQSLRPCQVCRGEGGGVAVRCLCLRTHLQHGSVLLQRLPAPNKPIPATCLALPIAEWPGTQC